MPVIVFDGPEKAGKTTIIDELRLRFKKANVFEKVFVRHWGPVEPDDRVYAPLMFVDSASKENLVIWDRCWPSEYVYGILLNRATHRMSKDPWIGEWLHGRAVQANGLRVMVVGPNVETLERLRDKSDLKVPVKQERQLYQNYGTRFGWTIIEQEHSDVGLAAAVERIQAEFLEQTRTISALPPVYCGPANAEIVFVGEKRNEREKTVPGSWLPFTSRFTEKYGRILSWRAFECGWTNAHDCPPVTLRSAKTIVACGKSAESWVKNYVNFGEDRNIITLPHPSYLYRYNTEATREKRESVDQILINLIKE